MNTASKRFMNRYFIIAVIVFSLVSSSFATDRLKSMPGYEQYQKMSPQIRGSYSSGSIRVTWSPDSKTFEYRVDGNNLRYDIAQKKAQILEPADDESSQPRQRRRGRMGWGGGSSNPVVTLGQQIPRVGIVRRQTDSATSPDKNYNAFSRDGNLYISDPNGDDEIAITTDGDIKKRIRYGIATLIYGEELGMVGGIFWSPDSKKIAYYRFDEGQVQDFYVERNQLKYYNAVDIDPYPKAGTKSPLVELFVYDLQSKKSIKVDVRDGKPFDDSVIGYYVYRIYWTPDAKEIYFHRLNRKQDSMDFAAANPNTGKCRVIVHQQWLRSWVDWTPTIHLLEDGKRFIFSTESNGYKNYSLYDLTGKLINKITDHKFEVDSIVRVDEPNHLLYYTARDGDNHMKLQLHRVTLDGKNDKRLTDPAFNHSIDLAPDGKHFIDVAQTHNIPPVTKLVDADGNIIDTLAKSDLTKFNELGLKRVELFTFTAADGKTTLHGMLNFPSNFDPAKKYPLLVTVYGGPTTNAARESFSTPNALTEYGFLVASFDSRSAAQRGKDFIDAYYANLGIVEMDDQAEGVKELIKRSYVDKEKVGVFGTSYGGTAAATLILRYPDVFQAACSNSPVTDYRNYNNIYAERFHGPVEGNEDRYEASTIMTYADNLKGRLLLYYGTADNNVHPSNSLQLIQALQRANKSFEVQVGPDRGHTAVSQDRMMEFFIENLVMGRP